ncbi:MAG: ATP-dependent nuclease, partial [Acidimicrobiales bacterium]
TFTEPSWPARHGSRAPVFSQPRRAFPRTPTRSHDYRHDHSRLVGANNEGKSNILRAAIVATTQMLGTEVAGPARRRREATFIEFVARRDLPHQKTSASPSVEIKLQLTDAECEAFHQELGHKTNNELRFKIDFLKPGPAGVRVLKQRSGTALTDKSSEIADFVRQRLRLEYIPAVRTAEQAVEVVQRLVADQLRVLRRDKSYIDALNKLRELEKPVLASIESDLAESLAGFLPELKSIEIKRADVTLGPVGSFLEVVMDDGVPTDLAAKGDGVQSLAAIALARRAALRVNDADHHLILAIEEPETHLHPAAIRRLRSVLRHVSTQQQVILTTHSPLLIDTEVPSTNIVVENQSARPARSVAEIRDCLGVTVADNLTSARLVVLVEGPADAAVLSSLLVSSSNRLAGLIDSGELHLEPLGGASKLSAHASALRATACSIFAVLDDDLEGRQAIEAAAKSGRIAPSDYLLLGRPGMKESELEDLLLSSSYGSALESEFAVQLNVGALGNGKARSGAPSFSRCCEARASLAMNGN